MNSIPQQHNTSGFSYDAAQGKMNSIPQQHSISGFDYDASQGKMNPIAQQESTSSFNYEGSHTQSGTPRADCVKWSRIDTCWHGHPSVSIPSS
jgi:hypothetical protein